jgi:aspartate/methionine/tyrosine aminotransferase
MGGDNVASARRSSRQISSLGSTISSEELLAAFEIRQSAGVRLVNDETYGLLTEGEPPPPAACADPTAVSLSTMSKTFGLPGIRIGWITTRDADLMHRLLAAREHITNNVLGEYIALQVQRDPELLLARARARVAENRAIVADVIENNPRLDWIPPTTVSFKIIRQRTSV